MYIKVETVFCPFIDDAYITIWQNEDTSEIKYQVIVKDDIDLGGLMKFADWLSGFGVK